MPRRWTLLALLSGLLAGGLTLPLLLPGQYVFLTVDESNGTGPADGLIDEVPSAGWHDGEGRLYLEEGSLRRWHRLVCLHEADAAGVRVASRLYTALRFPAKISICASLPRLPDDVRLLAGPLEVLGVDRQGAVRLRYDRQEFTLRPGQGWAQLRARGPEGEHCFSPAEAERWRQAVEEALAEGYPVTRIVITYHGRWSNRLARPLEQEAGRLGG